MTDAMRQIEADWAAKVARLEARCDELNEACSAKQALLDHVAADERDFMELVEGYKRERDAARALLAAQEARAQRVEAALRDMADHHDGPRCILGPAACSHVMQARAALAQPAATGSCPHEHRDWDTTDGVRCVKCGATHLDRPDSAQPDATGEGGGHG